MQRLSQNCFNLRFLFAVFLFLFLLSLPPRSSAQAKTILVIPKGVAFPYWEEVGTGAKEAGREYHVNIIWRGPNHENEIELQNTLIAQYLDARQVDAIVLAPSHAVKLNRQINRAMEMGVKVVIIDSPVTTTNTIGYVGTDNYKAGQTGAKRLLELLPPRGKVLLMGFVDGSSSTDLRSQGFMDYMHSHAPGITIARAAPEEGTLGSTVRAAEKALETRYDGIFAANETASRAVLGILEQEKNQHIPFVAFDMSTPLAKGLKDGVIDTILAQDPHKIGYIGVQLAVQALNGKPVPCKTEIPIQTISTHGPQ